MSNYNIGEIQTRFWRGEKYQFEYMGNGEWKILKGCPQTCPFTPQDINNFRNREYELEEHDG